MKSFGGLKKRLRYLFFRQQVKRLMKKDQKWRANYAKIEVERLILKSLLTNKYIQDVNLMGIKKRLTNIGGDLCKIQNRCLISGRSGGIVREYKMSRIEFKLRANLGEINGVKKKSW